MRRSAHTPAAWICLALILALPAAGAPVPAVRPMYFEHLTMRDGLSQSTVMSILQDSRGYLWLATESGLDRYDGYSIREYRRQRGRTDALASDYVWKIAEDVRGDLWLATSGGGVARWDSRTDRFQQFRHDPHDPASLASDTVRTLLIDAQDRVWVGTELQGLDLLDPRTGRVRHFRHEASDPDSLASDGVFALYADRSGRLWVGTDAGLSRYDPGRGRFINYDTTAGEPQLSEPRIRSILEDHTGALWIGTLAAGLTRLDPQTGRVTSYRHDPKDAGSLSADRVLAILEDDAQRLWVATSGGLDLLDRDTGRFVRYGRDADNPQSLRDDDIMSLYQDRGGVLWVGTRAGGASHWNPQSWMLGHYLSPALRNAAVNAFADDGAGHVWVGTSHGLVEIDTHTHQERVYTHTSRGPLQLTDDRVMALLWDRSGALWIGTMAGGLQRFDPARGTVRTFAADPGDPAALPASGIMSLFEDRHGDLWIGTFGGGLAMLDRERGALTRYPVAGPGEAGLSNPRASAIAEDLRGNLWIGTIGGGLNLLERRTGRFHVWRRNDRDPESLSDDIIYAVHVDRRGTVWVGTAGGGLNRVKGSSDDPDAVRFESESRWANLPSQVIYGIESDADDRLWLSTNNGLVRLDPRADRLELFHEAHGLQAEEFNFNAHYRGRDGTLYFGGNNGFNAFQPAGVGARSPAPQLALTGVTVLNRTVPFARLPGAGRPLRLRYDDKLVTFQFSALDFTSPANNRYRYRLEGFDSSWMDIGRQHRATYTNLDAGDYVFRVLAANADGVWSAQGLAVPVHVTAAPWNTWQARVLYVLLGLLTLGYIWHVHQARHARELRRGRQLEEMVRQRTHELEERNGQLQVLSRAKSDFLARMSHEMRTPMNAVLGMSELLLDTHLDGAQRRFVEGIHRSAGSLLTVVDDVLDFSKIEAGRVQLEPTECDLVELVEQTAEMLTARAAGKGIELICDSPPQPMPRVRADAVRLRQVLVNLGGNAVKFTNAGHVILRVAPQGRAGDSLRVCIQVTDTGIGIHPENQARIFEEFSQEDASTTRRFGGTGLGLAIARQLVELMGGRIDLASAPGAGSTFTLELLLPLADPLAPPPPPMRVLGGLRVLVIEHNELLRRLIVAALAEWQARPSGVASFEEARLELRASACEVVVMDDSLPQGTPAQLLAQMPERATRPGIIRLASFARLAHSEAAETQGVDAELTKPLRILELHQALSEYAAEAEGEVGELAAVAALPEAPLTPLAGRVLVVEDQPLNREVAEGMLRSLGLEVELAADGRQALEKVAAGRYDLVLMDCQMPVMDGFSAAAALRRNESGAPRLPVIALTADTTPAGREACIAAGMDDYLGKPFSRATLHAVLKRWLAPREPGAPPEA